MQRSMLLVAMLAMLALKMVGMVWWLAARMLSEGSMRDVWWWWWWLLQ